MRKSCKIKVLIFAITILTLSLLSACTDSGVNSAVVPEDAKSNVIMGKYKNSADGNTWQFNKDGSLVISDDKNNAGEYDVKYDDSSMYLTNTDGATISFYYKDNGDGTYDITINGENADTSQLEPIDQES